VEIAAAAVGQYPVIVVATVPNEFRRCTERCTGVRIVAGRNGRQRFQGMISPVPDAAPVHCKTDVTATRRASETRRRLSPADSSGHLPSRKIGDMGELRI